MPASLNELLNLLDLETIEDDLYRGHQPRDSHMVRVYGGQVAAQALVAAVRSVQPGRNVHSLHCYFVLGGDPSIPIVYDVERIRDGGSFSTRRVSARQHGEIIFYMTASFHKSEAGFEHQSAMPTVPSAAECPSLSETIAKEAGEEFAKFWAHEWAAVDVRMAGDNRSADDAARKIEPAVQRLWFRANGEMPDDPLLHACVFTYMSDLSLLGTSLVPHGVRTSDSSVQPASLDHAIWFHEPMKIDQWHLYDQVSPIAHGALGLSMAKVFTESGKLMASVAQEGLIRPV